MKQSRFLEGCAKNRHHNKKYFRFFGDSSSYQVPKEYFNSWLNKAKNLSVERDGDTFFKMSGMFKSV